MDMQSFLGFLDEPNSLDASTLEDCREIMECYPFFQTAHVLYTKNLKNCNHFKFEDQLKLTSLLVSDRDLFRRIMEGSFPDFSEKEDEKESVMLPKIILPYQLEDVPSETSDLKSIASELRMSQVKRKKSRKKQQDLIDKFVKESSGKSLKLDIEPTDQKSDDLITETLAEIYVKQGLYEDSIRAFERLCLKYPEKNAYFATRINEIEKLLKK